MDLNGPTQLFGQVCWLPSHTPGKQKFLPKIVYRVGAKFTSNINYDFSVLVSYSEFDQEKNGCYPVRLYFPFLDWGQVEKFSYNAEVLLMDGFMIIGVCRNLIFNTKKNGSLGDTWNNKS